MAAGMVGFEFMRYMRPVTLIYLFIDLKCILGEILVLEHFRSQGGS